MRFLPSRLAMKGGVAALLALFAASPAIPRGNGELTALSTLEAGRWQLRDLDSGREGSLCIGNRRALMQARHGTRQCGWTVIRNEAAEATITFTCDNGSGRTALRVETPRLAQIDTQGILNGSPYALRAEARHVGSC